MRLADRVRHAGTRPWHFDDWPVREDDWPAGLARPAKTSFPTATETFDQGRLGDEVFVVEATDVAQYLASVGLDLQWRDIVTTVTAPFPRMFFEYRVVGEGVGSWRGLRSWGTLVEQVEFDPGTFGEDDPQPRWGLSLTHLFGVARHDVCGPVGTSKFLLLPDGRLEEHDSGTVRGGIDWVTQDPDWIVHGQPDNYTDELERAVWELNIPTLFALSLMHCRNVETRPVDPDSKMDRARKRRGRPPLVRYHVLELEPMATVLETEGGAATDGLGKALHQCRGHFKTYGPGAPLFGRFTGQWWWNEHRRGSSRSGVVEKDYRIVSAHLGRPYRRAKDIRRTEAAPVAASTASDPDRSARGAAAHAAVQNQLADVLLGHGIEPRSPSTTEPNYDLACSFHDSSWVVEVKSLTDENEERQLRTALGQILRYRHALASSHPEVRAAVAVERRPSDESWIELFEAEEILLTWPGAFEVLVDIIKRRDTSEE